MPLTYEEAIKPIQDERRRRLSRALRDLRATYPKMPSPELKAMAERTSDVAGLDDQIRAMGRTNVWRKNEQ